MGTAFVDKIRRELADAGDAERAVQQQRYMKSRLPFYGVPMPAVRQIVRSALGAHPIADQRDLTTTVLALWDGAGHREDWYAALAVLQAPRHRAWRDLTLLPQYDHLVVTGHWWDVVDDVATHALGELLALEPERVGALMRQWAVDDDLWRRRAALVCQVGAKDDTDVALLEDVVLVNLDDADFFVRKGIGWALRAYAHTDPEWVRAFVDAHRVRMSPLSLREAPKHQ